MAWIAIGREIVVALTVNGRQVQFDGDESTPLLWVIRDHLQLTGTKFGCGIGQCGACTVHIDGRARRTCVTPVGSVAGRDITTIEGLAKNDKLHPVQQAWLELDVPQCGYCQAGQIMATVDFLSTTPNPSDEDINRGITNICRCGTYVRLRKAVHRAAELQQEGS
ncbi:MAG: (2Fe-2S)-binding protein [Lysobacteraceae bacterium]|nr:MAG: (2Fe-2S)-binding protein [Xanthomonadaceae bacterium]